LFVLDEHAGAMDIPARKPETMQPDAELHRRPARIFDGRLRGA
jgi:hypothetical protein